MDSNNNSKLTITPVTENEIDDRVDDFAMFLYDLYKSQRDCGIIVNGQGNNDEKE